jgi:uncharacterized membrane protein YphA (DoxX/SURF4 family)
LLAGAWTLSARVAGGSERSVTAARILFGLAVIPIGLSHLVYPQPTREFVPAWLPFRTGWGYLTGAGQIASGLGVLFGVLPRVAAWAEAAQITLFTLLVWIPRVAAAPRDRLNGTDLFLTWVIGAAAWIVAQNTPARTGLAALLKPAAHDDRPIETAAGD